MLPTADMLGLVLEIVPSESQFPPRLPMLLALTDYLAIQSQFCSQLFPRDLLRYRIQQGLLSLAPQPGFENLATLN
jgi:hypothetical protein